MCKLKKIAGLTVAKLAGNYGRLQKLAAAFFGLATDSTHDLFIFATNICT